MSAPTGEHSRETIAVPVGLLRDLLQVAQSNHEDDDCECDAEIMAPIRGLLDEYDASPERSEAPE